MTAPMISPARRGLRFGGLAAAILLALPAMAVAQEAAQTTTEGSEARELDTITVTAQRRVENI